MAQVATAIWLNVLIDVCRYRARHVTACDVTCINRGLQCFVHGGAWEYTVMLCANDEMCARHSLDPNFVFYVSLVHFIHVWTWVQNFCEAAFALVQNSNANKTYPLLTAGGKAFSAAVPSIWNSLRDDVVSAMPITVISARVIPRTHSTFGDKSFAAAGPQVWNNLPSQLWQDISYGQFKRQLKHFWSWLTDHDASWLFWLFAP